MARSSRPVVLLLVVTLVSLAVLFPCDGLRLCHTNDFHAKYLPIGSADTKCQWWDAVKDNCYSGVARLVSALSLYRCDFKIQAGDWVQGSLLDTFFQQDIAIEAYRWAQYDVAVFGNHEFDYGNAHINDTVRGIAPFTKFLSTNVFFDGQGMDDLPLFRFLDQHGICWVSTLTTETLVLSQVEDNVRIEDEAKYMRAAIGKCEQQNNVIAITHQGYNNDIETCKNIKELDLVIGGHSHTNLNHAQYPVKVTRDDGSVCFVTQTYAHGRYLGVLDVSFDDTGAIIIDSSAYVALDFRVPQDLETLVKVQMYNMQVAKEANVAIGEVTGPVDGGVLCRGPTEIPDNGDDAAKGDCSMGALVCDAMLADMGSDPGGLTTVCFMNGGTFRSSFGQGPVSVRDVVNVLPFGNTMVRIKMTGTQLRAVFEHGFSLTGTDNRGGFPGGLGNMGVVASVDGAKPAGEMVSIAEIYIGDRRIPLKDTQEYIVVTNGYIAEGGDGYTFPPGEDVGTLLRDITQNYLIKEDPYDPVAEPRILMSGQSVGELNAIIAEQNAVAPVDASKYVDEVGVETELDDTLIIRKENKCRGRRCSA